MSSFDRRYFLRGSAALGGAMLAGGAPLHRSAEAAPVHIDAPVVDRVVVQEITDGAHDIFLRGAELPGLSVQRVGPASFAPQGRTLSSGMGARIAHPIAQGRRDPKLSAGFRLHSNRVPKQPGPAEDRRRRGRCADPQSRAF
jgi:hypothetical protein